MAAATFDPEAKQSGLGEHFAELKRRLLLVALALSVFTIAGIVYSKSLMSLVLSTSLETYFFTPSEAFAAHVRVALLVGLTLSWPVILVQAYLFAAPGLYPTERRTLLWIVPSGMVLFVAGGAFGYFVAVPVVGRWLGAWAREGVSAAIAVSSYVGFVTRLILVSSLSFQMPLVALVLSALEIVSAAGLARQRRWVILIIFVLAAIITPPDVISQLIVAGPMWLLYEISVLLARLVEAGIRRRRRRGKPH